MAVASGRLCLSVEIWRVNRDMVCSATLCSCLTCNLVIAQAQLELADLSILWPFESGRLCLPKESVSCDSAPIARPLLVGFEHLLVVFLRSFGSFCSRNHLSTTYQLIISYLSNYLLTLLAAI